MAKKTLSIDHIMFFISLYKDKQNNAIVNKKNLSKVYDFVQKLLMNELTINIEKDKYNSICDQLKIIDREFPSKLSVSLNGWINDCLLGAERYDEYLQRTEPKSIFFGDGYLGNPNTRCNVFYHINKPVNPIDIIKLNYADMTKNLNKYTLKNKAQFENIIVNIFSENAKRNGQWLTRILGTPTKNKTTKYSMFLGAMITDDQRPKLKFPYYKFDKSLLFKKEIPKLIREAENLLREANNLPRIGEGWVSETELYYAIKNTFSETEVMQHGSPAWLGNQHLDIWIPKWQVAIEYHGKQHFEPVAFFGGAEGHEATKERDARKEMLCNSNDVKLIIATEETTYEQIIEMIIKYRC